MIIVCRCDGRATKTQEWMDGVSYSEAMLKCNTKSWRLVYLTCDIVKYKDNHSVYLLHWPGFAKTRALCTNVLIITLVKYKWISSGMSWCGRFKQKNTFKKTWLTKTAMEKDVCGEKQNSRVCEVSWWWCWQNMEVILIGRGYGKEWSRWFAIPITSTFLRDYYLQYTNFLSLINKELVIVSVVISAHASWSRKRSKQRQSSQDSIVQ